jgi:hypothetical protein
MSSRPLRPSGRVTALLVSLFALLALVPATASAAPIYGYGDQNPEMFTDARWQALPLKNTRRTVDWDTSTNAIKTGQLDTWMATAQAAGATPLLAIDRSYSTGKLKSKPSIAQYRALITWLKKRYPWWNTLTPWNEANYTGQPTAKNPKLAYQYWQTAKSACKGCTVTSPVLLLGDKGVNKKFIPAYLKLAKKKPAVWAIHDYGDQNRGTDKALVAFEKKTKGTIWVTEAAGWVKFLDTGTWPYDEARAAKAITEVFTTAKKSKHKRIARWYFYQWRAPTDPLARWDSGVLNVDGTERKGYFALKAGLGA